MRIVLFSTPDYTKPVLDTLKNAEYDIVKIIRSKNDLNFEEFSQLKPDLCIVAAFGKIIPKKYLDIPQYGFINIHPSLLPKYRGASPIKSAILNGEVETGVTIMKIDEEMDHGPILISEKYQINPDADNLEVQKELWDLGAKLLIDTLPKYISREVVPQEQDHGQATYTKKFTREDGRIDWSGPAEKIYNQIRALSDEPGTWTTWHNKTLNIRIARIDTRMTLVQGSSLYPGTIVNVDNEIAVATGKCYLILKTIQLEGKKETDAKSFINGYPDFIGSKLE